MKKKAMATLGLAVVLVAVFAVISVQSVLKIEDFTWTMSTVQDANGNVIACGSSNAIQYPDAEETSLSCEARKGVLTLVCGTEETAGTYHQTQQNQDGRLYEMEVKGLGWGYGVCAYTVFDTGERLPTLVITFPKDKTLTFTGSRR